MKNECLELEQVQVEEELSDYEKIMILYKKLNHKLDLIIEKKSKNIRNQ